jgi:hypothetical protein
MLMTIEFFSGLILVFAIGYLLALLLEKVFHVKLENPDEIE